MGASYKNSVTQWSNGQYDGANNLEDDLAILFLQLGPRADEAGNVPWQAAPATITSSDGTIFKAFGVIGDNTDHDWWQIEVLGSGEISIAAEPYRAPVRTAGGNLDIKLRLKDSQGRNVMVANPSGDTSAALTAQVEPGTYYIDVSGDEEYGRYSSYASLGQYHLSGIMPKPCLQPGEMRQFLGCSCVKQIGETGSYTRRRYDGLIEFCVEHSRGRRSWGRVRAKPDGATRFDLRAETMRLRTNGDTVCAIYRPRENEESAKHELRLITRKAKAVLRF